jgi:ubiquinone/menaquinone biosynthesis C-methylase UbiE
VSTPHPSQPDFDSIARPYRWLEYLTLGPLLQNCRTHYLSYLLDRRQALILGDGDGRFTARLLQANSEIRAVAVDTSATMLLLLRNRCDASISHASARLQTVQQSALETSPESSTDLIVSHFFLDCLTQAEVDSLVPRLARHTAPGALWLLSDFHIPANSLRIPAHLFVRALYFAFSVLTGLRTTQLPDHAAPLRAAGFHRIAQHPSMAGLLTAELWQKA